VISSGKFDTSLVSTNIAGRSDRSASSTRLLDVQRKKRWLSGTQVAVVGIVRFHSPDNVCTESLPPLELTQLILISG
jgi:hypothetical protein